MKVPFFRKVYLTLAIDRFFYNLLSSWCWLTIILTNERIIAIKIAAPKEEKPKLYCPTKFDVHCSINALITKLKKPSVNIVNGNDKTINIGFIIVFSSDKTILATSAVVKLLTKNISGKRTVSEMKANMLTKTRWKYVTKNHSSHLHLHVLLLFLKMILNDYHIYCCCNSDYRYHSHDDHLIYLLPESLAS